MIVENNEIENWYETKTIAKVNTLKKTNKTNKPIFSKIFSIFSNRREKHE